MSDGGSRVTPEAPTSSDDPVWRQTRGVLVDLGMSAVFIASLLGEAGVVAGALDHRGHAYSCLQVRNPCQA